MSVHDFWGISEGHGRFRGQLRWNGTKLHTGSYTTVLQAVKDLDRLIYITHSPQPFQIGLTDAEKLWLDTHSLDDLKLEFKRACIKPGGSGSSNFRGVRKTRSGKFEARVTKTINGCEVYVFQQVFDDETEAARAYDRAVLQHRGRNTVTNFRYNEVELADIKPGSKQCAAVGSAAAPSAPGKPKTQRKKGKAVTQDVEEDGSAEDSADEDDAESDTTSADDGDDSQEHSDGSLDGATTKPKSAGPSTRRAPARGCAAKHKSLDVDAMLHVVSDGNSDTGSAVDHADDDTTMDGDLQADDLPYADNDQDNAPSTASHNHVTVDQVTKIMQALHNAPVDHDERVRDLLTRRVPEALQTARNGNLSFGAAYWGDPPAGTTPPENTIDAAADVLHKPKKPPAGSAREGLHLQSQEILRLVLAGHTAEEIAAPALNPYMRPVIDSKLAPPPSAAMPAGVTAAAGARVSADSAAAVAAAGDGTAANTGPADAAIGILAAAGPAQKHPPSDIIEAVAKTAAATSSVHGGSPGLRAQQLPCAAQASTAEIMKGAAYGEAAGSDTLSMPSATLAPACNSKPLADAAVSLSPKPCTAGASASPTGANTAAPNMVTGSIEAANASSKEKMWTRSSRGGWLKTGRRRTGFKGGKNATAAAAAADEPTASASAAEPGGRPKTSGVLLAERYYAASFAATEAWYAEQDASAARAAAQRLRRRRKNEQKEQRLLRFQNAPFDLADWLGPFRNFIKIKVAQGPAGRSWLLACGIPEEEIPLTVQADAELADIPPLDYAPHMMDLMLEVLLPDWDSEGYAKTYNRPSRATQQLQRYQIWPQDKPSGWTFDKAQAEEAEEEYAEAMDKRRIILRKRAVIEDVKARRARGEPIVWKQQDG